MGIGNPVHLAFIAIIALIVLGPKRLPELARSLGDGMRHFRESLEQASSEPEHPEVAPSAMVQPEPFAAPAHDAWAPQPDPGAPAAADAADSPWSPVPDPAAPAAAAADPPWSPVPEEAAVPTGGAPRASRGPGGTGRAATPDALRP